LSSSVNPNVLFGLQHMFDRAAAAMNGPGEWRRPSRSVMTKIMKESVKTGHPTGLPDKLLRLFAPGPPVQFIAENAKPKKKPKLPYTGA
jgi:hypothetical protein